MKNILRITVMILALIIVVRLNYSIKDKIIKNVKGSVFVQVARCDYKKIIKEEIKKW